MEHGSRTKLMTAVILAVVLGTGVMGAQIAAHCANAGLKVFAFDMDQPGVEVRPLKEMTGRALFNEVFICLLYTSPSPRDS